MVEVVKRGSLVEKTYDVTCRGCGSELRFKVSEARRCADPRDGDYYEIHCPVCERPVTEAAER